MFLLLISNKGQLLREEKLAAGKTICIGRHRLNDVQLPDPGSQVSRFHVALFCDAEGQYYLQDLGSRNGTLVNGKIQNSGKLNDGDEIGVGEYVLKLQKQPVNKKAPNPQLTVVDDGENEKLKTALSPVATTGDETRELREEQVHFLYKMSRYANSGLDSEDVLQLIINKLYRRLRPERIFMALLEPKSGNLNCLAKHVERETEIQISRTMLNHLLQERQILVTNDALTDSRFQRDGELSKSIGRLQINAAVCVPLLWGEEIRGILYLDSSKEKALFSGDDLTLLKFLGRDLAAFLERSYNYKTLRDENKRLETKLAAQNTIIGISTAIKALRQTIDKISHTEATILITGETGTGKNVLAEAIHQNSKRKGKSFLEVNCAAIPENLLESELFGVVANYPGFHNKEALRGKFELADGGAIFLNEIGELEPKLQAKLLEILEQQCVWPLGAGKPIAVDVRIIAATNRDLQEEVKKGRFREDLFERLNVFPIHLPPLRERKEDVPILAGYFLHKMREKHGKPISRFSNACIEMLSQYSWPRNVRELRNAIERAMINAERPVLSPELFNWISEAEKPPKSLEEVEKEHIIRVLEYAKGKKQKAMRILGISKQTLYNKAKLYKLPGFGEGNPSNN